MHGVFCATKEDALKQALSYIKEGSSVSWGGSMSVSEIGLMDALKEGNYHLIDRSVAKKTPCIFLFSSPMIIVCARSLVASFKNILIILSV